MNISQWLRTAQSKLEKADIPTARLDSLVMLEKTLEKERSWLLAHDNEAIKPAQLTQLDDWLQRRAGHEPLAYILGEAQFYGRPFYVSEHTLVPRPESETMIELLKKHFAEQPAHGDLQQVVLLDVGTGSGALAITAKLELEALNRSLHVAAFASDIDSNCLEIAQQNAARHQIELALYNDDLLGEVAPENIDVILANLPYVPDDHTINQAAMQEPKHAIFGGPDGLDLYRKLFAQAAALKQKPHQIFTESLPFQHAALADIAKQNGYAQLNEDDFIQLFARA